MNNTLARLMEEISFLKNRMCEVSERVDRLTHPRLVQISQILDQRLNQKQHIQSD